MMNAYDVLNDKNFTVSITEGDFYKLINKFRDDYFKEINYKERLAVHRKPVSFLNELLQGKSGKDGLYNYLQEIQRREEMIDIDSVANSSGHVNSKIESILENDNRVKTLFNGIGAYTTLRSKDFNTVAVHVAEYRAMNKAVDKIKLDIAKYQQLALTAHRPILLRNNADGNPDISKSSYFQNHIREMAEIRRKFEVVDILTNDEVERLKSQGINVEEGQQIRSIPQPRNHTESYEFFKGYIGETMCSIYKNSFYQQYGSWIEQNVKAEIEYLTAFVNKANLKSYKDAVNVVNTNLDNNYNRYLRLKNGYYLYNNFGSSDTALNSPLAVVYGKYFLFFEYLTSLLGKTPDDFINVSEVNYVVNEYAEMIPTITWTSDNSITVQDRKYYFPFYGYNTCTNIMLLKEELWKPTVSALTLQEFPNRIFDETLFKGHYDFAGLIYNIIETIVEDAKCGIHKGNSSKERLFDSFLKQCEIKVSLFLPRGYSYSSLTIEAVQLLTSYADAHKCFTEGLEKITKAIYERNALDDLRLSLELLLKGILSNNKSLENQKPSLGTYCHSRGISSEAINMFVTLVEYYAKYQNNYVKHNDKINVSEIDFILNLTSTFIKLLIQ